MIKPVVTPLMKELRAEGARLLSVDGGTLCPDRAREGQLQARRIGDPVALALWSKVRVRALRRACRLF